MAERKLATIEKILKLESIENSDFLELATVRGWHVVVKKGEFSVGDAVVYFEIDSFFTGDLLENPTFSFLKDRGLKSMNSPEDGSKISGHALRTIKLRGQISQGLVVPLDSVFAGGGPAVGTDVTEDLGILKYEPYIRPGSGPRNISTFPTKYAVKSDAERVQNFSERTWSALQDFTGWYPTLKIDGQSVTYWKDEEGTLKVATRNYEIVESSPEFPPYGWMVKHYDLLNNVLAPGDALQGELYGPGIQGNRLGVPSTHFSIFNFFHYAQLMPREVWELSELGVFGVPLLNMDFPHTVEEALEQAYDLRYSNGSQAEGIVWHNSDPEVSKIVGRNCFKVINDKFLLKNES